MSAIRGLLRGTVKIQWKALCAQDIANISARRSYCNNPSAVVSQKNEFSDLYTVQKPPQTTNPSIFAPADSSEVSDVARYLKPTYTFAAYVNESETLQQLVKLGVDLSKIEKNREVAQFVFQLNFEKDVKPYIRFLHDVGVEPDALGSVLTKNMLICKESLEDLQIRINYLESKKFDKSMIGAIVMRNPLWLTTPVSTIDSRLGWWQTNFKLSGDEVRTIVNLLPQIVTFNINTIKLNLFVFEEEMGMSKGAMKRMLLKRPKLFITNQRKLLGSFEYVHKVMGVPVDRICHQPDVLMERTHKIKERHLFLASIGRAQYNPLLPGYISLDALVHCNEVEFCTEVAKSSVLSFDTFLKTL